MSLSHSVGALSITQTIGSTATSNVHQSALVTRFGVRPLIGPRSLPAIVPPRTFSFPIPLGTIGTVGVLGVMHGLDDSSLSYDFATVNTGGSGPTVEELKKTLRRSGLSPKGF